MQAVLLDVTVVVVAVDRGNDVAIMIPDFELPGRALGDVSSGDLRTRTDQPTTGLGGRRSRS